MEMERNHLVPHFHLLLLLAEWPFSKLFKLKTSSFFSSHYSYYEATPTDFFLVIGTS